MAIEIFTSKKDQLVSLRVSTKRAVQPERKEDENKKDVEVLKTLNLGAFNSGTSTSALQPQRSLHHLPNYPAVMFTPGLKTSPKKLISSKTSSKMNGALSERLSYFRSTRYSVI